MQNWTIQLDWSFQVRRFYVPVKSKFQSVSVLGSKKMTEVHYSAFFWGRIYYTSVENVKLQSHPRLLPQYWSPLNQLVSKFFPFDLLNISQIHFLSSSFTVTILLPHCFTPKTFPEYLLHDKHHVKHWGHNAEQDTVCAFKKEISKQTKNYNLMC